MGNEQVTLKGRSKDEWFLKNTVAGGGKWKSVNGWRTGQAGWKPVLLTPTIADGEAPTAWRVVPDKTSIEGRPLRLVAADELGSACALVAVYGHCFVTDASVPSMPPLPLVGDGVALDRLFAYLKLVTTGARSGRLQLAVVQNNPNDSRPTFHLKQSPELRYVGRNESDFATWEMCDSTGRNYGNVGATMTRLNFSSASLANGNAGAAAAGMVTSGVSMVTGLVGLASIAKAVSTKGFKEMGQKQWIII